MNRYFEILFYIKEEFVVILAYRVLARFILFKHMNNFFHKLYRRKYYESNVGIK